MVPTHTKTMLSRTLGVQQRAWRVIGQAKYWLFEHYPSQTLRISLILLCLALTALFPLLSSWRQMIGLAVVGASLGAVGLIFIYRNNEKTCLLILIVTTVFNFGVGTGTGTPIMLSLLLLMGVTVTWLARILLVERSFKSLRPSPVYLPTIVFSMIVIVSYFWSWYYVEQPVRALFDEKVLQRGMTALVLIISPATIFIIGNVVRSLRAIKFMTWWFIGYGAVIGIVRLLIPRVSMPVLVNDSGQIGIFVALLSLGQALTNHELKPWMRLGLLGVAFVWLRVSVGLGITWLSGWVPMVIGVLTLIFMKSRKLFFLVLVVIGIGLFGQRDYIASVVEAETNESGITRLEAGRGVFYYFERHYLFGTGPAGYHFYMELLFSTNRSHNNYLDILGQTGIVGFLCWIWLWLTIGVMVWKMYRSVPKTGFRGGLALALLAWYPVALTCMQLGDWLTPFPYTQTLRGISYTIWHWILAGLAMSLYYEWSQHHQQGSPDQVLHEVKAR